MKGQEEHANQEAQYGTTYLLPASMEPPALDTAGAFCDRLLSLSAAFMRLTHAVPQIRIPFLFGAKQYSTIWVPHILCYLSIS